MYMSLKWFKVINVIKHSFHIHTSFTLHLVRQQHLQQTQQVHIHNQKYTLKYASAQIYTNTQVSAETSTRLTHCHAHSHTQGLNTTFQNWMSNLDLWLIWPIKWSDGTESRHFAIISEWKNKHGCFCSFARKTKQNKKRALTTFAG